MCAFPIPHSRFPIPGLTMNFFEQQALARKTTTRLVVLFSLAVLGIVLAVDLAVALVFGVHAGALLLASLALARADAFPRFLPQRRCNCSLMLLMLLGQSVFDGCGRP